MTKNLDTISLKARHDFNWSSKTDFRNKSNQQIPSKTIHQFMNE